MNSASPRLSIVLPCYNEADTLPILLEGYRAVWEELSAELILVDNGSTDHTSQVLGRELSDPKYSFARSVRVPKNQGYGHGIFTGLQAAKGEYVGFSHADMQCSPADLFRAYHELVSNEDPSKVLIKGRRISSRGFSASLVTFGMTILASTVLATRLNEINAQPKVFHRSHLDALTEPPDGFQFDLYVLYKARKRRLKIISIPVEFGARTHGESKWAFSFLSRYRTIWATVVLIFKLRFGLVK